MKTTLIREWKKVGLGDLAQVAYEVRECVGVPAVVVLSGPVGVGKTAFVKSFMTSLNHDPSKVLSPTYSLVCETGTVVHADFYRLENLEELDHLELELYLEDKTHIFIEWGEGYVDHLQKILGDGYAYYRLSLETEESWRRLALSKLGTV